MITTVAAIVLAFVVGAILMIVSDTEVRSTYAYFFARPSDAIIASWDKVSSAYGALIAGSIGSWQAITETTAQAAPLICAGLGVGLAFRAGLFNIGAQGQAIWGAILAAYVGLHPAPATGAAPADRHRRRHHRRRDLGRHRRLAEGPHRRARGDRDDHDELHRRRPAGLLPHHDGLPAAGPHRPDLTDHRLERDLPAAGGQPAAPRLRGRADGRRGRLVDPRPVHHRLRDQGGRCEPARGGDRRDERRHRPRSSP